MDRSQPDVCCGCHRPRSAHTDAPVFVMYGESWCPYCRKAFELLTKLKRCMFFLPKVQHMPALERDCTACGKASKARSTIPQIFLVEGSKIKHIGGSSDLTGFMAQEHQRLW